MKKMAKQENIRSIFAGDIHAGIYACLNEFADFALGQSLDTQDLEVAWME